MARGKTDPLFLHRASYRQRRWRDVARMVPVVALFLWLLPLAWRGEGGDAAVTLVYIFSVWAILIVIGAIASARIGPDETDPPPGGDTGRG